MGTVVVCAEAVHAPVEVLQVDLLVVLGNEKNKRHRSPSPFVLGGSFTVRSELLGKPNAQVTTAGC